MIDEGALFYAAGGTLKQWINSKERQHEIVKSCHADKLGGHFGRDKTREKLHPGLLLYLINIHGLFSRLIFANTLCR